jgi:hypothetical protein
VELEGVVQNGVIIPEGGCPLPDGTKVRITSEAVTQPPVRTLSEKLRQLAEKYEKLPCDLPEDLSVKYDHYIHGTPIRT